MRSDREEEYSVGEVLNRLLLSGESVYLRPCCHSSGFLKWNLPLSSRCFHVNNDKVIIKVNFQRHYRAVLGTTDYSSSSEPTKLAAYL